MPFPAHYCCHFLHVPPSKDRPAVSATFHLPLTCLHLPFLACANVSLCQWKYRLPVPQELCLYWANADVAMEHLTSTKIMVALHKNPLLTADVFTALANKAVFLCFRWDLKRWQLIQDNQGTLLWWPVLWEIKICAHQHLLSSFPLCMDSSLALSCAQRAVQWRPRVHCVYLLQTDLRINNLLITWKASIASPQLLRPCIIMVDLHRYANVMMFYSCKFRCLDAITVME